jgi:hypothetical protein
VSPSDELLDVVSELEPDAHRILLVLARHLLQEGQGRSEEAQGAAIALAVLAVANAWHGRTNDARAPARLDS